MQVEVKKLTSGFNPIKVSFVIEDAETLGRIYYDFVEIGNGDCRTTDSTTWSNTDDICKEIAEQLRPFVEA